MASINQADENPKREKTILETVQMIWYSFVISLLDSENLFPYTAHCWEIVMSNLKKI